MKPLLSLEPLTLPDVGARQLVDIAHDTGFGWVSMVLHSPDASLPVDPIVANRALRRETAARMAETGVRLHNLECFNLRPDLRIEDCAAALACGQELGARSATAIVWENDDRADVLAKLGQLCDLASEHDIAINLEFFASSKSLPTLEAAVALVRDCARDNAGLMIDLLHLIRTGGSLEALTAIDPRLIGGAQVSDGPLALSDSALLLAEAGGNRTVPGEGEFPIAAFAAALPDGMVIGVEVPQVALIGTVAPEDRARRLYTASRTALRARP